MILVVMFHLGEVAWHMILVVMFHLGEVATGT